MGKHGSSSALAMAHLLEKPPPPAKGYTPATSWYGVENESIAMRKLRLLSQSAAPTCGRGRLVNIPGSQGCLFPCPHSQGSLDNSPWGLRLYMWLSSISVCSPVTFCPPVWA